MDGRIGKRAWTSEQHFSFAFSEAAKVVVCDESYADGLGWTLRLLFKTDFSLVRFLVSFRFRKPCCSIPYSYFVPVAYYILDLTTESHQYYIRNVGNNDIYDAEDYSSLL